MDTIETEIGYFSPVTTPYGLKELRWQQTPFCDSHSQVNNDQNVSRETVKQLNKYLSGTLTQFYIPIDYSNWSFAMVRWFNILCLVRYGRTISYQGLAKKWGNRQATRAAGQACKRNPIPIIIPCHRVLHVNESISRYSGGSEEGPTAKENLERKQWLINLEAENS